MNEFLSEEIQLNNILHDEFLVIKICKGFRPKISKDVPKLLANLIIKCWDAEIENRPTTKELYQILKKWNDEIIYDENSEIYFQIKKYANCDIQPTNPISECLDVQLNESELNEIYQDGENNIE
ncbi:uncharacterized protein OCT59_014851 [Rhizophagus irregularis]|nr:hypothetical protein OCT59_014851 [Rhizophagus irregularis]